MTTPTISELQEQRSNLDRQIAQASIEPLQDALALLSGADATTLVAGLGAIADRLPAGNAKTQIGNVLTVFSAVPVVISDDLSRAQGLSETSLPPILPIP